MDFHEIWYVRDFRKSVEKIKVWPQSKTLHEDVCTFLMSLNFLRMSIVLEKSYRENKNTNFVFNNFVRKSCRLRDNVGKYGTARHARCL